jgi:hypothetical protein
VFFPVFLKPFQLLPLAFNLRVRSRELLIQLRLPFLQRLDLIADQRAGDKTEDAPTAKLMESVASLRTRASSSAMVTTPTRDTRLTATTLAKARITAVMHIFEAASADRV